MIAAPSLKLITATPVTSCCEDACNDSDSSEKNPIEKKCTGNFCNPFSICCSCVLHIFSSFNYTILLPKIIIKHLFVYDSDFKSQYALEFWQPPKLNLF
jgi:hypothetical protein